MTERTPIQEVLHGVEVPEPVSSAGPPPIVQDFRPLAESLEARLASHYWETRGLDAFSSGDVPYAVNNTSWAAESAAHVLFASCCASAPGEGRVAVLELGAGVGLFALQLLDAFADLCARADRDFSDRLVYFVTDFSPRALELLRENDPFRAHGGRVEIARCDALDPRWLLDEDGGRRPVGPVQAVFGNYLLDTLPATLVRRRGGALEQLYVRARLARGGDEREGGGPAEGELRTLPDSGRPEDLARLLALVPRLEFDAEYRCEGASSLPYADELGSEDGLDRRAVLSFGAARCLEGCMDVVSPDGFVLVSDFGPTRAEDVAHMSVVHRYGASTAAAVNLPWLERILAARGHRVVAAHGDDGRSVHSRLLARRELPETEKAFHERYAEAGHLRAEGASTRALEHVAAGRLEDALTCYREAIDYCPRDWHALGQASDFLCQRLHRYDEALSLAEEALRLNPWYCAFLWNTKGNCLFSLGRFDEAHACFLEAQRIDPRDPQSHLNLAFSFAQREELEAALASIARGLACDASGRFRSALLEKQGQVLGALDLERGRAQQRLNERLRAFGETD